MKGRFAVSALCHVHQHSRVRVQELSTITNVFTSYHHGYGYIATEELCLCYVFRWHQLFPDHSALRRRFHW